MITSPTSGKSNSVHFETSRLDAIRHVLLRKLAPGLRHALMGQLQAVRWSAEATARILQSGADIAKAREQIDNVIRESASAIKTTDNIIEWLRPRQETDIGVNDGIATCIKLASEDWFLRGIQIKVELHDCDFQVSRRVLQEMVVAALLVLTDMYQQNADFSLTSRLNEDWLEVALAGRVADHNADFPAASDDRKLMWSDLELLAKANGVTCVCDTGGATLRFCRPTQGPVESS